MKPVAVTAVIEVDIDEIESVVDVSFVRSSITTRCARGPESVATVDPLKTMVPPLIDPLMFNPAARIEAESEIFARRIEMEGLVSVHQ